MKKLLKLFIFTMLVSTFNTPLIAGSKYTTVREEIVSGVYHEKRLYTKTGEIKSEKFVMQIEGVFWEAVKSADGTWNLTFAAQMKFDEYKKGGGGSGGSC